MLSELPLHLEPGALVRLRTAATLSSEARNLLTAFDRALIRLVAQGLPDRVMAQRLGVHEDQVRSSLLSIFRKLALAGLLEQLLYSDNETDRIAC